MKNTIFQQILIELLNNFIFIIFIFLKFLIFQLEKVRKEWHDKR